jgi:hypothetical protein
MIQFSSMESFHFFQNAIHVLSSSIMAAPAILLQWVNKPNSQHLHVSSGHAILSLAIAFLAPDKEEKQHLISLLDTQANEKQKRKTWLIELETYWMQVILITLFIASPLESKTWRQVWKPCCWLSQLFSWWLVFFQNIQ